MVLSPSQDPIKVTFDCLKVWIQFILKRQQLLSQIVGFFWLLLFLRNFVNLNPSGFLSISLRNRRQHQVINICFSKLLRQLKYASHAWCHCILKVIINSFIVTVIVLVMLLASWRTLSQQISSGSWTGSVQMRQPSFPPVRSKTTVIKGVITRGRCTMHNTL